jgi:exopolysaccharide production protein ExoZ
MAEAQISNPKNREIIGVQYLRGVAAMLVVIHHLYFSDTQLGPFGVQIFFVISGFVMWYTTTESYASALDFWRRRLVRIVPLYWIFLSILLAIALSTPQYLKTTAISLSAVIQSFLFIPHYHTVQRDLIAPILIPGWSLNYEMFFYALFGVTLLSKSIALRATIVALLLWSFVLIGGLFNPKEAIAATYTSPALLLFVDGIALAIAYTASNVRTVILGLVLICVDAVTRSAHASANFGLSEGLGSLLPVAIVGATLALEGLLSRAPSALLHMIGNASYSIYLSHLFFLRIAELQWRHIQEVVTSGAVHMSWLALTFVFAVSGGIVVHYFVERPILRAFQRNKIFSVRSA